VANVDSTIRPIRAKSKSRFLGQATTEPAKEQCPPQVGQGLQPRNGLVGRDSKERRSFQSFNHRTQTHDVTSHPQESRCCSKSALGKVAEDAKSLD
jgi:hypothetical protein